MGLSASLHTVAFEVHLRCGGCGEEIVDAVELPLAQRSLPAAQDLLVGARRPRCPRCHSNQAAFQEAFYRWDEQDLPPLHLDRAGVWRCAGRLIDGETSLRRVIGRPFSPPVYRRLLAVHDREDLIDVIPGLAFQNPREARFKRLRCGVWADMGRFQRAVDRQARRYGLRAHVSFRQISLSLRGLTLTMPGGWLSDAIGLHGLTLEEAASAFAIASARRLWMIDAARRALPDYASIDDTLTFHAAGRRWPLANLLDATAENERELVRVLAAFDGNDWPCGCDPLITGRLEWRHRRLHRTVVLRCRHWHQPAPAGAVPEDGVWPHHVRVRTAAPGQEGVVLIWGTDAASLLCQPNMLLAAEGVSALTPGRGGQLLAYPVRRDLAAIASPQASPRLVMLACDALRREAGVDHGWMGEPLGGTAPVPSRASARPLLTMIRI